MKNIPSCENYAVLNIFLIRSCVLLSESQNEKFNIRMELREKTMDDKSLISYFNFHFNSKCMDLRALFLHFLMINIKIIEYIICIYKV